MMCVIKHVVTNNSVSVNWKFQHPLSTEMGIIKSFAIVVQISPTDRESTALIFPNDPHKRQVKSKLKPHISNTKHANLDTEMSIMTDRVKIT
jgi:hypothetical protein